MGADAHFNSHPRIRHTATKFLREKSVMSCFQYPLASLNSQALDGPAVTKRPHTIPDLTHLGARTICRL